MATRNLVGDIRAVLATSGDVPRDALAKLVWEYASTCRQINEKAQQCLDYLRQGHRAEAMRLAKESPDLQQEIMQLDFAERPHWLDLCDRAGIPISEAFDPQALYSLAQEVYAEMGNLDQLLRTHRRMALGRAPVGDRLRILRHLKQVDPKDEFWDEDIRTFEGVYLAELMSGAERADSGENLDEMEEILAELQSSEWLVPPPAAKVRALERVVQPHRQRRAEARYDEIINQMHDAFSAQNEAQCADLLAQWQRVVDETRVQPDPQKSANVGNVQRWLADLQRTRQEEAAYQGACQALDQAIDSTFDKDILYRLEADVQTFNRGMSELTIDRLRRRVEEIDRRSRHRRILLVVGIIVGLVVIGAGTAGIVVWQTEVQRVAGIMQEADDVLSGRTPATEENLSKVTQTLAVLQTERPNDKAVAERLKQAEAALDNLHRRTTGFNEAMASIEGRITTLENRIKEPLAGTGVAALREIANRTSDTDANARLLGEGLDRQLAVAGEPAKKEKVEEARRRLVQCAQSMHAAMDAAFQQHTAALQQEYMAFAADRAAGGATTEELVKRGRDLLMRVGDMPVGAEPPRVIKDSLAQLRDRIVADLAAIESSVAENKSQAEALVRIGRAYTGPDALAAELAAFATKYPSAQPYASDFAKVARLAPYWRAEIAWQAIVSAAGKNIRTHDSPEIEKRFLVVQKYLTDFPESAHKTVAEQYMAYLQTAKNTLVNGSMKDLPATRELLKSAAFRDLYMIKAEDGRRFYLKDKKDLRPQVLNGKLVGYSLNRIVDGTLAQKSTTLSAVEMGGKLVEAQQAPQTEFAKRVTELSLSHRGENWETFYLELAQMTLDQPDMDPILTASILKLDILPRAAATTPAAVGKIQAIATLIDGLNLGDIAWMNPEDVDANGKRPEAAQVLRSIGSLVPIIKEVNTKLGELGQSMTTMRPVAVLLSDDATMPIDDAAASGPAYVIWDNEGVGPVQYKKIGTIEKGTLRLDARGASLCPRGSLIFVQLP
jgi:hypothetical protein